MILVILGGTCSGKTTFASLCEKYGFPRVITNTTRSRRVDDLENSYNFLSVEEFEYRILKGNMIEYTKYNGNYYGLSKDSITKNCCVVLDPRGYYSLKREYGDLVYGIYLDIPYNVRLERGISRGDDLETLKSRLSGDEKLFDSRLKDSVNYIIHYEMLKDSEEILRNNLTIFVTK